MDFEGLGFVAVRLGVWRVELVLYGVEDMKVGFLSSSVSTLPIPRRTMPPGNTLLLLNTSGLCTIKCVFGARLGQVEDSWDKEEAIADPGKLSSLRCFVLGI